MTTPHRLLLKAESEVHNNIFSMADKAKQALNQSMQSLQTQDAELAQQVIEQDLKQNYLMRLIEKECLEILATLEPKASDLREVIASLQIASELERIADHAKSIAKIVLNMDSSDFSGPMDKLSQMSDLCENMLIQSMEAYQNFDIQLAQHILSSDCQLDELDEEACSLLMMTVMSSQDHNMRATHLMWIAYHLERIGDRITNIAERVIFMVTAETPDR